MPRRPQPKHRCRRCRDRQRAAPATSKEDLSYPERLGNADPPARAAAETHRRRRRAALPPAAAPAATSSASAAAPRSRRPRSRRRAGGAGLRHSTCRVGQARRSRRHRASSDRQGLSGVRDRARLGAPAVFRVRVGKFKDRSEAESVVGPPPKRRAVQPLDRSLALASRERCSRSRSQDTAILRSRSSR